MFEKNELIPDRLMLSGKEITVNWPDKLTTFSTEDEEQVAEWDPLACTIHLSKVAKTKGQQMENFVHECVEMMNDTYDLGLPHSHICMLACGFHQVLNQVVENKGKEETVH